MDGTFLTPTEFQDFDDLYGLQDSDDDDFFDDYYDNVEYGGLQNRILPYKIHNLQFHIAQEDL